MKRLNRIRLNQQGYALVLALLLLALGSLLVVPSLHLAYATLQSNIVVENKALGFGAADAGFENALWNLQYNSDFLLPEVGTPTSWTLEESVNDCSVDVTISNEEDFNFKIISKATDNNSGDEIEVVSYIELGMDFSGFFDNAITSDGDVTIMPGTTVSGNVTYSGYLDNNGEIIDGTDIQAEYMNWPRTDVFIAYYWAQIEELGLDETPASNPYAINIVDGTEADPVHIGPLYAPGNMDINCSGANGWGSIDGLVYVKGDLVTATKGHLDLNGSTIFVEGSINIQPGFTLLGSGCIIAVGDINFKPNLESDENDFIFLFTIEGQATVQPGGDFYGSIAGDIEVYLSPGNNLTLTEVPDEGINFPGGEYGSSHGFGHITNIKVYIIN
jgi:hypothetical protein